MEEIILSPAEVQGLRRDLRGRDYVLTETQVQRLEDRVNGEAEARAALAGFTHESIAELTNFAIDTVAEVDAMKQLIQELAERTALGLTLVLNAVEERPTLRQRLRALVTRARAV